MRFTTALMLAAVGASAHPSGHGHLHRAAHEKRDDTVVTATIDGKVVSWTQGGSPFKAAHKPTTSATTLATSTTTPVAAAKAEVTTSSSSSSTSTAAATTTSKAASTSTGSSTTSSSGSSGSGISEYVAFPTCSSSKKHKKRATSAQIAYSGNTGCDGYGSNVKLIQSNLASDYDYTVKAVNGASSSMQCKVWNKIGSDGGINGFFSGNEVSTFTIAAGASQYVAFDSNTQGGMCCEEGSVSLTSAGEFLCPWLEFDFADSANSGWSGFDASALVAGAAGGTYAALKACTADGTTCSELYAGGGGSNAYLPGDEAADGIGGNLAAGDVSLIATWS